MCYPKRTHNTHTPHNIMIPQGINVRNTSQLITPDTRLCTLTFAPSGFGKTTMGESLNRMTKRFFGKPSIFIAVEAGEGGGTMAIEGKNVDFVVPHSINEFDKILAWLVTDTTYGGVVLDSSSELVRRFLQPMALSYPSREKVPTRAAGVPERSDYQTMGELARQQFNRLINLTTTENLEARKHLFVTALQKEKTDDKGNVVSIRPDLPGAMADTATAMFQSVCSIAIRPQVLPDPTDPKKTIRVNHRVLLTDGDGVRTIKDRTKLLPNTCEPDFEVIYEKYWLPKFA